MVKAKELQWDGLAEAYPQLVYSITATAQKRNHIVDQLRNGQRILIVGCGSESHLQRHIVESCPDSAVYACDFSQSMLEVATRTYSNDRVIYQREDTTHLTFPNGYFDVVVSTNSIIPEHRDEVLQMYAEISRVLRQDGSFLAFLPSFDYAKEIAGKVIADLGLEGLSMVAQKIDEVQARLNETSGWQCFHTRELIRSELRKAGFLYVDIEKISVESQEEREQLLKIYDSPLIADSLWEYFVRARKSSSNTPFHTESLAENLTIDCYTSLEIDASLVGEISSFYRYMFNNANGHFLVFPSTGKFLSPQEIFNQNKDVNQTEYIPLDTMDAFTDYPIDPQTGEKSVLFHDPETTFQKISEMLRDNAFLVVLRDKNTGEILGVTYEYEASLKVIWEREWSNKYIYAALQTPGHDRSFQAFMDQVQVSFKNAGISNDIDENTTMLCWNCAAIKEDARNFGTLLTMARKLHAMAQTRKGNNTEFTILESVKSKNAYPLLRAAGCFDIPGVLDKDTTIVAGNFEKVLGNIRLPVHDARKLILCFLRDSKTTQQQ